MCNNDPIGTAFAPSCKLKNLVVTVAHNVCDMDGNMLPGDLHVVRRLEKPLIIGDNVETFPDEFRNRACLELVECNPVEDWAVLKLKSNRNHFVETLDVLLETTLLPRHKEEERFKIYHAPSEYFLKNKELKSLEIEATWDIKSSGYSQVHKVIHFPIGLSKGSSGGVAILKRGNTVVSIHLSSTNTIEKSESGSTLDDLVTAHNSVADSHASYSTGLLLCACPTLVKLLLKYQ